MKFTTISTMVASASRILTADSGSVNFEKMYKPIVDLINSLVTPALAIVGALGSLFCIILGVKYAKAEEPQEREKAKQHLKSAIIGFVLIFVLMLALKMLMPILNEWVNKYVVTNATT